MIKLLGIFLIFVSSSIIGLLKMYDIKERRTLLLDFKETLAHIDSQIGYFKEPLPQIFESISSTREGKSRELLETCVGEYKNELQNLNYIWKKSICKVYDKTSLNSEDLKILQKAGSFLGQSDFKGHREHFKLLNVEIDKQLDDATHEINTKGKMYGKMGVSIGIVIAIILL